MSWDEVETRVRAICERASFIVRKYERADRGAGVFAIVISVERKDGRRFAHYTASRFPVDVFDQLVAFIDRSVMSWQRRLADKAVDDIRKGVL